jgi:hypothetical protein
MAFISFQPKDHFSTKTWTGDGQATNAITGVGFQPDWVWIKQRDYTRDHHLYDVIRGVTKALASNNTDAETTKATGLTAFGADGFTLGADSGVNANTGTYAAWNWKAGGAGSANSDGSIASTVSANTTSGFSIVKFTGTGANGTVGHGLGAAVDLMFMKQYEDNSGFNWKVYERSLGANKAGALDISNGITGTNNNYLNNTHPTSSVFSVGADNGSNKSGDNMIVYCFAKKKGFSNFGQYTGNGNTNGPFIFCGFKPAFVIFKKINDAGDWQMVDDKREGYNPDNDYLQANAGLAEQTTDIIDLVSNGFKIRGDDSNGWNKNASTYLWIAFAEEPLVASNGDPATAR